MRRLLMLLVAGACLAPVVSTAQEERTPPVKACIAALQYYLVDDDFEPGTIQDLTELTPPRVRLGFGQADAECKFSVEGERLLLSDFCLRGQCFAGRDGILGQDKLEEIQFLLKKNGF